MDIILEHASLYQLQTVRKQNMWRLHGTKMVIIVGGRGLGSVINFILLLLLPHIMTVLPD